MEYVEVEFVIIAPVSLLPSIHYPSIMHAHAHIYGVAEIDHSILSSLCLYKFLQTLCLYAKS